MKKWRLIDLGRIKVKNYYELQSLLLKERQMDEIEDTLCFVNVKKHVWIGKNTWSTNNIEDLVNIKFCEENKIPIIKDISPGGAFIVPEVNINFILFAKQSSVLPLFYSHFLFQNAIKRALSFLGISVQHNDFIVNGRKIGASSMAVVDDVIFLEACINLKFDYEINSKILTKKGKGNKILQERVTSTLEETGKYQTLKIKNRIKKAFQKRFGIILVAKDLTEKEARILRK